MSLFYTMIKLFMLAIVGGFSLLDSPSTPYFQQNTTLMSESSCSLPEPKNIHVEETGTSYFVVVWDVVPDAAYFRVYANRSIDGKVITSVLVPALPDKNSAVVDNLTPGESYFLYVYAVCSNGIESTRTF